MSLIDLMHCKKGVKENVFDFIDEFKHLHAQISFPIPNVDIQCIIDSLKNKLGIRYFSLNFLLLLNCVQFSIIISFLK